MVAGVLVTVLVAEFFLMESAEVNGQFETPMSFRDSLPALAKQTLLTRSDAIMQINNGFIMLISGSFAHRAVMRLSDGAVGLQTK